MRVGYKDFTFSPNATMTQNLTSDWFWLGTVDKFAIQAAWTGTPSGNLKLQCSSDSGQPAGSNTDGNKVASAFPVITNIDDVAGSTVAAGGAAGSTTWNASGVGYLWVRVAYTFTASTGTLTARCNAKGY